MDSVSPLDSQLEKLSEKLKTAKLPQELLEKTQVMISLLKSSPSNLESVSDYVNWVSSLPFEKNTTDNLDLKMAKQILDKNHFGLELVKSRIIEYLSTLILQKKNPSVDEQNLRAPILCLVGLVGTGKTTLAYSIAEALGRKFERIPFGGMGDSKVLRGQSRTLAGAEPGLIIKSLVHAASNNPVILLDELDRITENSRADVMGVLVELLDPQQNKAFLDQYIDYPFDLSNVLFVATANNITNIATAVLDRLEVVQMPSYSDSEKLEIAKNYLFPKIRAATGLSQNQITVADDVWSNVVRPLGYDPGTRGVERAIEEICRKAAREIVEGKLESVNVTNENFRQFLSA